MQRHSDRKVHVLVVWEPILATDWRPPSASTLGRIADGRARQFWDPKHLVAMTLSETAKREPRQPQPECCIQKGFYWDEAILYPSGARWKDARAPAFWNGPVVRVIPGLENSLNGLP